MSTLAIIRKTIGGYMNPSKRLIEIKQQLDNLETERRQLYDQVLSELDQKDAVRILHGDYQVKKASSRPVYDFSGVAEWLEVYEQMAVLQKRLKEIEKGELSLLEKQQFSPTGEVITYATVITEPKTYPLVTKRK